jgi:hypothetical protein
VKIESFSIIFYTAIFLLPGFFIRGIIAQLNPIKKLRGAANFFDLFCEMGYHPHVD